ncbi:MAG: class I SAM-dependent methyltransferase [Planctomycetota bacterium]
MNDVRDHVTDLDVVDESIYDHPKYYDLVFGADVAAETKFILGCCDAYLLRGRGTPRSPRFLEPACGTGRLLMSLLRRGHAAWGLDLNSKAVEFCNARMNRHDFGERAIVANMCDFRSGEFAGRSGWTPTLRRASRPFCVAFNTINSFRHVATERDARRHFECMADVIRPGGLYLLGVHLTPTSVPPSETESWSARRGHLAINTHMWTIHRQSSDRIERFGIRFDVHTPSRSFRINDELHLRSYTPKQMQSTIGACGQWDIVQTHDFAYDLHDPIEVDSGTEDVVYVLRRR